MVLRGMVKAGGLRTVFGECEYEVEPVAQVVVVLRLAFLESFTLRRLNARGDDEWGYGVAVLNELTARSKTSFRRAYSHLFFQVSGLAFDLHSSKVCSTSASRAPLSMGRGGSDARSDVRLSWSACIVSS